MRKLLVWAAILMVVAVIAGPATARGGGARKYGGTLTATPDVLRPGESFTVNGCGYDTTYGNVIIGFTGGGWGSPLHANGCFVIPGIPALSGDTLPPGTYEVTASQLVRGRWRVTGETYVTVVP